MSWTQLSSDHLTWDALATGATGLLAVLAATWVGIRQLRISDRQSSIQEAQRSESVAAAERDYSLRKQEFRLALFDKRFQLTEDFRAVWTDWSQNSRMSEESLESLRVILQRARMLFSESLCQNLENALISAQDERRFYLRSMADDYDESYRTNWREKSFLEDDKVKAAMEFSLDLMIRETRIDEPV